MWILDIDMYVLVYNVHIKPGKGPCKRLIGKLIVLFMDFHRAFEWVDIRQNLVITGYGIGLKGKRPWKILGKVIS